METPKANKANHYLYNPKLKAFARELRSNMTKSEVCLWHFLLKGKGIGYAFRRQRPIGNHIVDFISFELMLVIECDGASHHSEKGHDRDLKKDRFLNEVGFKVMRFEDGLVLNHIDIVELEIMDWIEKHALPLRS